jgi:catechol 2,3-dioxygenase-like lactoylglutathione lyase family enzyme
VTRSEWVRQARQGDRDAYDILLADVVDHLSRIAWLILRDIDSAEDVADRPSSARTVHSASMGGSQVSHVAITVPDLERAEAYYQGLFNMQIVTREARGPEGDMQLPPDKGWRDAREAGIDLYMVALRLGDFVLALFDEASPAIGELGLQHYRPLFVGLHMPADTITQVRTRLRREGHEEWDDTAGGFRDRYGVGWQLAVEGAFVGAGDRTGRWVAT